MSIKTFNLLCGITGLIIIWLSTHNWIAVIGGVIAGIHINLKIKQ